MLADAQNAAYNRHMIKTMPHIHLSKNKNYGRVLVCGAPERAARIAAKLDDSRVLAQNREYHSYLGRRNGRPILVCSHGVGSAGAAICFQELINVGAQAILRLGTAGALQDHMEIGTTVIATGAARKDGVSALMVPLPFPAIPDSGFTLALQRKYETKKKQVVNGIVVSSDLFYPALLGSDLEIYRDAGAVAAEMECSTLFICGSLRKVKTASILITDGNPLKWKKGNYNPGSDILKRAMDLGIDVGLDVLSELEL
jgi:uridine phosphorylase